LLEDDLHIFVGNTVYINLGAYVRRNKQSSLNYRLSFPVLEWTTVKWPTTDNAKLSY